MKEFSDDRQKEFAGWLNRQWHIRFNRIVPGVDIQGSPERTLSRIVIQDESGCRYLLEKFPENKLAVRQTVAQAVAYLNDRGVDTALAYQKTVSGRFLPFYNGCFFGLSPYVEGSKLQRPEYLSSSEMGDSLAGFLLQLARASSGIETQVAMKNFSLKQYIYKLFREMKIHDKKIYDRFIVVLEFLDRSFMQAHDHLPQAFCHGDLHPLNVIWEKDRVKAVIDWEFAGIKPQIYDAANLVGCAGIENPEGLGMPMVITFLRRLKDACVFERASWTWFPEYTLALRFAWLAEWVRQKDEEMIDLEYEFMIILLDNLDILRSGWRL